MNSFLSIFDFVWLYFNIQADFKNLSKQKESLNTNSLYYSLLSAKLRCFIRFMTDYKALFFLSGILFWKLSPIDI